ncbi:MAG: hypothetical protein V7719_03525 [Psychroserpens sp.]|uniref:hypothetical protein n=1 Tax=Psychroserpens sp. TaxID=2020870 RepID=UPI00300187DC
MNTNSINAKKLVLYGSMITSLFFLMLYFNTVYFKSTFALIGVFQELLTIPFLLIQPVLLVLAFKGLIKESYNVLSYSFLSVVMLLASMSITWSSFFLS